MELKLKNAFFQMPVIAVPTKQSKSSVAPEDGFFSKAMLTSLAGGAGNRVSLYSSNEEV